MASSGFLYVRRYVCYRQTREKPATAFILSLGLSKPFPLSIQKPNTIVMSENKTESDVNAAKAKEAATCEQPNTKQFDPDFDADLNQCLISGIQKLEGCFSCGKQGADRKCSACKVAVYCDKACQLNDFVAKFTWTIERYKNIASVLVSMDQALSWKK